MVFRGDTKFIGDEGLIEVSTVTWHTPDGVEFFCNNKQAMLVDSCVPGGFWFRLCSAESLENSVL